MTKSEYLETAILALKDLKGRVTDAEDVALCDEMIKQAGHNDAEAIRLGRDLAWGVCADPELRAIHARIMAALTAASHCRETAAEARARRRRYEMKINRTPEPERKAGRPRTRTGHRAEAMRSAGQRYREARRAERQALTDQLTAQCPDVVRIKPQTHGKDGLVRFTAVLERQYVYNPETGEITRDK